MPLDRKFYALIESSYGRALELVSYDRSKGCFAAEHLPANGGPAEMIPVTVVEYRWG